MLTRQSALTSTQRGKSLQFSAHSHRSASSACSNRNNKRMRPGGFFKKKFVEILPAAMLSCEWIERQGHGRYFPLINVTTVGRKHFRRRNGRERDKLSFFCVSKFSWLRSFWYVANPCGRPRRHRRTVTSPPTSSYPPLPVQLEMARQTADIQRLEQVQHWIYK